MLSTKSHILTLLKNDLINTRLLGGLNNLGLEADNYVLNLNDLVFELLELEDTPEVKDQFYAVYQERIDEIVSQDAEEWEDALSLLPADIYKTLLAFKQGVVEAG